MISRRLFLFSRQNFLETGCAWINALVPGTTWDAEQMRIQYKARGICTLWIKDVA